MIKAITFDLWDTIVDDDSDEPKRATQGLRSKKEERRHIVWTALNEVAPIEMETVNLAYDVADASFNIVWKELFINWTVEQRIRAILNGLDRSLPKDLFDRVVKETGDMEVNIPPNAIKGVKAALADLSSRYKLCIVSDAIVTPGTGLRQILEDYDLKQYFSGFAFSDEVGHSKPHRSMFDAAAEQLGVQVEEMLHIGDRDHNDIKGPHALGMKAILFTATRDADKDHTTADAIVNSYADLPSAIDDLADTSK
ncbi:HAD family hydrolase [Kiloniella majae]|uniref:HAD family hydrolase n=1 Tax=Kiloniella majae TaxID=1938558 RepID=UPI000A2779B6|nr:HAD family hydrolase [Kiloniella majae]